jgi:phosphoglycerate dehydrogenase-like enzyme
MASLVHVDGTLAQEAGACPNCEAGAAVISRYGLEEAATPANERRDWAPPRRIVTVDTTAARLFRTAAPQAEVYVLPDPEAFAVLAEADVFIGLCDAEILDAAPNLKWIHALNAGVEVCAADPSLIERNVLVTNGQRLSGPQIAEHAIAMVLSFARGLPTYAAEQRAQRWSGVIGSPEMVLTAGHWELTGRTMLVVGLGGIGTEIARRANALGMRVLATRNSSREGPDFIDYVGLSDEVNALAARADVVVSAVPLTGETTGMFDAAFFRAMKPAAYFINVSRGETAVTDDLVEALRDGRIAGAGLDVTDPEPLPAGHPLWSMPNVILTPHIAVASDVFFQTVLTLAAENVRRYAAGEPMISVVDLARGY